ncbi:DUF1642 domain-containing protein [Vagococcus fluvialis]|uniref:DUF1642 domain-containing protein n=1 Tax=Vagococcus fluvialis TaxID=2738 RepID=UPI0020348048|nr:DUF1642 domain-containing protein [Vagococcus fluvialis]MCM2138839.1 DUF1642 domain-containing protein [Vagococcus fluvialis]
MRIDDENKVVVPDFVAEWIEYNLNARVDLQIMVGCYASFLNRNDDVKTDGEKAVEWFVENPYQFIRAYVEGYTVKIEESNTKYYWRKKKEYLAWFENIVATYLHENSEGNLHLDCLMFALKATETEARDLLKDDFDKFEKVECE